MLELNSDLTVDAIYALIFETPSEIDFDFTLTL